MRFGILATPVWGAETPPAEQLAAHRELVVTAQELGFDSMVAGQHFLSTDLRYYQPVPYLAHLATHAPRMRVVTGIILLSLAHPVDMAEQIATLDVVTGGRAVFGVGLGYADREFRALGIDRASRVRRFEESLALIRALWSGDEVSFRGEFSDVDPVLPSVLPVQRPGPPIWIGGQSENAVRRAARMADAWYAPPFPTHDGLAVLRAAFLEERGAAGLPSDGEFPVRRELVLGASRAEARRAADDRSARRFQTYLKWGLGGDLNAETGELGTADDTDERFILGSPEDCAEQLQQLEETLGMTEFMYKPHWPGLPHAEAMRQLEVFGTKVMPLLAAGRTATEGSR